MKAKKSTIRAKNNEKTASERETVSGHQAQRVTMALMVAVKETVMTMETRTMTMKMAARAVMTMTKRTCLMR